jgi:nitrite reductase/ring-hydroxylating ferredoxin subunit
MGFTKRYKWHKIADSVADIQWSAGAITEVAVDGKTICVGKASDEQLFGFAANCPHAGAPMQDGYVDGSCRVVCPVHSMKFDLIRNGREANGDGYRLKTYPVEKRADGIYLGVEEGGLFKWL